VLGYSAFHDVIHVCWLTPAHCVSHDLGRRKLHPSVPITRRQHLQHAHQNATGTQRCDILLRPRREGGQIGESLRLKLPVGGRKSAAELFEVT
jgi:hypothetical protein